MTRNELQQSIIDNQSNEIILLWSTRCGKTRAAILASKGKTLIVCAEKLHLKNWANELELWTNEDRFDLALYHNLHKIDKEYDTIIYDEIHHGFSEKRIDFLT